MQKVEIETSVTYHLTLKGETYSLWGSQKGVSISRVERDDLPYNLREMRSVRINSLDELNELEVLLRKVKAHFVEHRGEAKRCPYPCCEVRQ